jgi:hypothetical protein
MEVAHRHLESERVASAPGARFLTVVARKNYRGSEESVSGLPLVRL